MLSIVNKQRFNITAPDLETGKRLQIKVNRWSLDEIPAALNSVFEQVDPDQNYRFDYFKIELGTINENEWDTHFLEKLKKELYKQLKEAIARADIQNSSANYKTKTLVKTTIPQNDWEALVFYVQNGFFPWWYSPKAGTSFFDIMLKAIENGQFSMDVPAFVDFLLQTGSGKRIVQLLGVEECRKLFVLLFPNIPKKEFDLFKFIKVRLTNAEKIRILEGVFYVLLKSEKKKEAINPAFLGKYFWSWSLSDMANQELVVKIAPYLDTLQNNTSPLIDNLGKPPKNIFIEGLEECYRKLDSLLISEYEYGKVMDNKSEIESPTKKTAVLQNEQFPVVNAGLVLAWPFLPAAFENLGFLMEKEFISPFYANRAAVFLHYLVYKALPDSEHELLLNKVICGIPFHEQVDINIEVPELWKTIRKEVLSIIISQWQTLGKTSTHTLASSFLMRDGILKNKDDNWQLYVERKAIDILLDKLPWPVSNIKYPWTNYLISITW